MDASGKNTLSNSIAVGKDLVALLRDFALFLLAILLLAFPLKFNSMLEKAGFQEGSLVGFKWKNGLEKSDRSLMNAQATIKDLQNRLDSTSKALKIAEGAVSDTAFKNKVAKLQSLNEQVRFSSNKTLTALSNTISSNANLLEPLKKQSENEQFGIVYSGSQKLNQAQYEAGPIAQKYQLPNVSIYYRHGYYRSVAIVNSREEAGKILARARKRRADAYVVAISSWCSNSIIRDGYLECKVNGT